MKTPTRKAATLSDRRAVRLRREIRRLIEARQITEHLIKNVRDDCARAEKERDDAVARLRWLEDNAHSRLWITKRDGGIVINRWIVPFLSSWQSIGNTLVDAIDHARTVRNSIDSQVEVVRDGVGTSGR